MEGLVSMCCVAVSTLLVLCSVRLLLSRKNKSKPKMQMPPGPWTLPVIGSLHHLITHLPYNAMTQLSRRHGPLMLLKFGQVPMVVVSSAEVAEIVMKTQDLAFASRSRSVTMDIFGSGGKDIVFAPYGAYWRQMRKICVVKLLSTRQVNRMESILAEELGSLLRHITASASAGSTINVSDKLLALSNDLMTRTIFGGRFEKQGEYLRELGNAFSLMSGFSLVDLFPSSRLVRWLSSGEREMKRCHASIEGMVADAIEARRAAGAAIDKDDEDFLDFLLRMQQEDSLEFPLTTEAIGAVLFNMFTGATETTGNSMVWAVSELIRNPETMAKAQHEVREVLGENRGDITSFDLAELHYLRMVIKEVLRLHTGPIIPRRTREDCKVMGYDIPKDTNVWINLLAISRDPTCWNNPEEFKPERFENININYNGDNSGYLPFGTGRRKCPGIQFSLTVMELVLANFLYHFDWMLPNGEIPALLDMSVKYGLTMGRRNDLQLKAITHWR